MLSWVEGSSGELLIFQESALLRRDVMEATGVISDGPEGKTSEM